MKRFALALAFCLSAAVDTFAVPEKAKRAQMGDRVAGQSVPVLMGVFDLGGGNFETRMIRLTTDNKLIVDASGAPVSLAAPVTQGAASASTADRWHMILRDSVGDEYGIVSNPFAIVVSDFSDTLGITASGEAMASVTTSVLTADLAALLAKVIAAPATEAKQDVGNTTANQIDASVTLLLNQGAISRVGFISDGTGTLLESKFGKIEQNTTDPVTLNIGIASTRIIVTNVSVIGDGNTNATFKSNATSQTGDVPITKNSGYAPGFDPTGHFRALSGEALVLQTSSATRISGWYKYLEVPD